MYVQCILVFKSHSIVVNEWLRLYFEIMHKLREVNAGGLGGALLAFISIVNLFILNVFHSE